MNKRQIMLSFLALMLVVSLCIGCQSPTSGIISEQPSESVNDSIIDSIVESTDSESTDTEDSEETEESEEIKPEDLEPVKPQTKEVIRDMTNAFAVILEKGTRKFFEGYPIDESFLHWVNNGYGDEVIMDIAYRLFEGYDNTALWYSETGNSMHVLWLMYCQKLQMSTYYLDNVNWIECASGDVVKIDFTGDINLADDWYTMQTAATKENGIYDCISKDLVQELQSADISVVNNEFVISDRGKPLAGKAYTFRAKTTNVGLLEAFGADVANLANNHVCDFGNQALLDTKDTLEQNGIVTMGAGANIKEASAIKYFVANGKKIALVTATEIEKYYNYTKEATETTPGVLKTFDTTKFNAVIKEASANSDYVIANVHWGTEGQYKYNGRQYNMAKQFVNAGADVVVGGHPHRLQGVEYIKGAPVLFSLGNFWFSTGTLYTTIAQVQIDEQGEIGLRMIPCMHKDVTTYMLEGEQADAFYKFMADLSKNVVIDKDGYFYNTAGGKNAHLKDGVNYQSGMAYDTYDGKLDLEGREINIVGNLRQ